MDIFGIIIDVVSSIGGTLFELIGEFLSDPFGAIFGIVDTILGFIF